MRGHGRLRDCERMGKGELGGAMLMRMGDMGAGTGSWGSLESNACMRRRMGRYCFVPSPGPGPGGGCRRPSQHHSQLL